MGQICKFRRWRQRSTEIIFGFLIFLVTRGFLWRFNHFTLSCLVNQTLTNSNLTRTREDLLHEFFIIERGSVTSSYHGTKMSASQQSFLTETDICIVERWKESMGMDCHICSTTVYWDPEILLPWQPDVTTSPPRGEKKLQKNCVKNGININSHHNRFSLQNRCPKLTVLDLTGTNIRKLNVEKLQVQISLLKRFLFGSPHN